MGDLLIDKESVKRSSNKLFNLISRGLFILVDYKSFQLKFDMDTNAYVVVRYGLLQYKEVFYQ